MEELVAGGWGADDCHRGKDGEMCLYGRRSDKQRDVPLGRRVTKSSLTFTRDVRSGEAKALKLPEERVHRDADLAFCLDDCKR